MLALINLLFHTVVIGAAALLPLAARVPFSLRFEGRSAERAHTDPGLVSGRADSFWRALTLALAEDSRARYAQSRATVLEELRTVPGLSKPEEDEGEMETQGTYERLPEVRVDLGHGAIFPVPIQAPKRFSWFRAAVAAAESHRAQAALETALYRWRMGPSQKNRAAGFPLIAEHLERSRSALIAVGRDVRYLETWIPPLSRRWSDESAKGRLSANYLLMRAFQEKDEALLRSLREVLRPRRVTQRPFLPERLPPRGGDFGRAQASLREVVLPIATDIADSRFIKEVEGAVDTHWNQSPWARANSLHFKIRWKHVPRDARFAAGKSSINQHLAQFPKSMLAVTTGGLTTYVKDGAMVLGPGRITPRTIAHEVGHLLGFGDCYFRTLSSQGVFGNAVLEWDNPFFPDDLMCDNLVGVAHAESWDPATL